MRATGEDGGILHSWKYQGHITAGSVTYFSLIPLCAAAKVHQRKANTQWAICSSVQTVSSLFCSRASQWQWRDVLPQQRLGVRRGTAPGAVWVLSPVSHLEGESSAGQQPPVLSRVGAFLKSVTYPLLKWDLDNKAHRKQCANGLGKKKVSPKLTFCFSLWMFLWHFPSFVVRYQ